MICSLINIININTNYLINKLSTTLIYLLNLNKISINLLIILVIMLLVTSLSYCKLYLYTTYLLVTILLNSFIYFIDNFTYGYFKIHPTLFYLALSMYVWGLKRNNFLKFTKLFIIVSTTTSIVLGSLWALYQLSWGYYWSNDPIELALLFISLIFIMQVHTGKLTKYYIHMPFLVVILYIHLIRMGYIYTKHNFFSLLGIFIAFFLFFLYWFNYIMVFNTYVRINLKITKNYILWIIFFLSSILFVNYSYNFYIQKLLKIIIKYSLVFLSINIIWKKLYQKTIHIIFMLTLLLFNAYSMQYLIFIKLSLLPDELIMQINKKKAISFFNIIKKYFFLNFKKNTYNLFSFFKFQINTKFFLQKNLINFF